MQDENIRGIHIAGDAKFNPFDVFAKKIIDSEGYEMTYYGIMADESPMTIELRDGWYMQYPKPNNTYDVCNDIIFDVTHISNKNIKVNIGEREIKKDNVRWSKLWEKSILTENECHFISIGFHKDDMNNKFCYISTLLDLYYDLKNKFPQCEVFLN